MIFVKSKINDVDTQAKAKIRSRDKTQLKHARMSMHLESAG